MVFGISSMFGYLNPKGEAFPKCLSSTCHRLQSYDMRTTFRPRYLLYIYMECLGLANPRVPPSTF